MSTLLTLASFACFVCIFTLVAVVAWYAASVFINYVNDRIHENKKERYIC